MIELIPAPVQFGNDELSVGVSIGIAQQLYGTEYNLDLLMQNTDKAQYKTKNLGKNTFSVYSPDQVLTKKEVLAMSKKHQKVLSAIFSDHLSSNIHWKEIESLLIHLGAEFREGTGASFVATLNNIEFTMHRSHQNATMSKKSLHLLRKFLQSANVVDN